VEVQLDAATEDTLLAGHRITEVARDSTSFAAGLDWFERHEPVTIGGRRYFKFAGPLHAMSATDVGHLERLGVHNGVPVFHEKPRDGRSYIGVIFVPVRPPCLMAAYYDYDHM
jgi:hypothetical protein